MRNEGPLSSKEEPFADSERTAFLYSFRPFLHSEKMHSNRGSWRGFFERISFKEQMAYSEYLSTPNFSVGE